MRNTAAPKTRPLENAFFSVVETLFAHPRPLLECTVRYWNTWYTVRYWNYAKDKQSTRYVRIVPMSADPHGIRNQIARIKAIASTPFGQVSRRTERFCSWLSARRKPYFISDFDTSQPIALRTEYVSSIFQVKTLHFIVPFFGDTQRTLPLTKLQAECVGYIGYIRDAHIRCR